MTTPPRRSIARLMAVIAVIAVDLAIAGTLPRLPNPGLVLMVAILEVGLFRLVDRRRPGRPFWLGFEAFGWASVLAGFAADRATWAFVNSFFEGNGGGRIIVRPGDMGRAILFAGVLQLGLSGVAAVAGGWLLHTLARGPGVGPD